MINTYRNTHISPATHPRILKIVSEFDQEIQQSQTADRPVAS